MMEKILQRSWAKIQRDKKKAEGNTNANPNKLNMIDEDANIKKASNKKSNFFEDFDDNNINDNSFERDDKFYYDNDNAANNYIDDNNNKFENFDIDDNDKEEIKDDGEYEYPKIFKKEKEERDEVENQYKYKDQLDNALLVYEVEKLHPRKWEQFEKKLIKYNCCETSTGCFGCGSKNLKSEINQYGVGVTTYFRTLKAFILTIFVILLMNIYLYCVYFNSSNSTTTVNEFRDILNKFSIGNLNSGKLFCNQIPISNFISSTFYDISFKCNNDTDVNFGQFGLSATQSKDMKNIQNCKDYTYSQIISLDATCDVSEVLKKNFTSSCATGSCKSLRLYTSKFNQSCLYNKLNNYIYITYACIPNLDNPNKNIFIYVEEVIDAASTISILICLFIIYMYQLKSEESFRKNYLGIESFTILISNIHSDRIHFLSNLSDLVHHINKVIEITKIDKRTTKNILLANSKTSIYEINYAIFNHEILDMLQEKERLYKVYSDLMKYYQESKRTLSMDRLKYENQIIKAKKHYATHLENIKISQNKYIEEDINHIYVTFKEMSIARKFYNLYKNRNLFFRCLLILTCNKDKIRPFYFKDKWLNIELYPDVPCNIRWENFSYPGYEKVFRKFITSFLAFLIFISSVAIFILYGSNILTSNQSININLDCNNFNSSNLNKNFTNENINNSQTICFCKNFYFKQGYNLTASYKIVSNDVSIIYPCKLFADSYSYYMFTYYILVVAVPFINSISRILLKIVVKFEKNNTEEEDRLSFFYKLFFVLFTNQCVSIILINSYVPYIGELNFSVYLLNGLFLDLGPSWYYNLGTLIIFYMILNIFEPHIVNLLHYSIFSIRRLKDSNNLIGINSKAFTKSIFYNLYIGPEFNIEIRYANILSSFYVCFFYSSAMPLIYSILFFTLILSYWIDKFLFLQYFKTPQRQNLKLSNIFIYLMIFGVLIHCLFGIWIHYRLSSLYLTNFVDLLIQKILINFNWMMLAIGGLVLTFILFKFIFWNFIKFCLLKCCTDEWNLMEEVRTKKNKNTDFPIGNANGNLYDDNKEVIEIKVQQKLENNNEKDNTENKSNRVNLASDNKKLEEKNKDYKIIETNASSAAVKNGNEKKNAHNDYLNNYTPKIQDEILIDEKSNLERDEDLNIYEALPIKMIYKNYVLTKLKFVQASKFSLDYDLNFLNGMFKKNIDSDRLALKLKYNYLIGATPNLNEDMKDFDVKMKPIFDNFEGDEDAPIKSDFSYSLAYVNYCESYLYNDYLKD